MVNVNKKNIKRIIRQRIRYMLFFRAALRFAWDDAARPTAWAFALRCLALQRCPAFVYFGEFIFSNITTMDDEGLVNEARSVGSIRHRAGVCFHF